MFLFALWLSFALPFSGLMIFFGVGHNFCEYYDCNCVALFWIFLGLFVCLKLVMGLITGCAYSNQLNDFAVIRRRNKKIELFEEKSNELSGVVRDELKKYPEFEKLVIGEIHPEFLLNFPQLQSNQTIIETVNRLVELRNEVYTLKSQRIDALTAVYKREISPWLILVKKYQDFFEERNPILPEDKNEKKH